MKGKNSCDNKYIYEKVVANKELSCLVMNLKNFLVLKY